MPISKSAISPSEVVLGIGMKQVFQQDYYTIFSHRYCYLGGGKHGVSVCNYWKGESQQFLLFCQ